jgi:hypothetical protein
MTTARTNHVPRPEYRNAGTPPLPVELDEEIMPVLTVDDSEEEIGWVVLVAVVLVLDPVVCVWIEVHHWFTEAGLNDSTLSVRFCWAACVELLGMKSF